MLDEKSDISFEEELDMLGIDYDDCQYLSDGSYGYFLILVTDLDDAQGKKLGEHSDYFKLTDDVWCRRLENPSKLPDELRKSILDFNSKKERERIKNEYLNKVKRLWENIVVKKERLNEIGLDQYGRNFFPPTKMTERVAALLGTFLIVNQDQFGLFCKNLYCYFNEFKPVQCRKFKKYNFHEKIEILRHTHSHDDENLDEPKYIKRMQKKLNIFQELIGKRYLDKSLEFNTDFLELQLRLLGSCNDWLDQTIEEISR